MQKRIFRKADGRDLFLYGTAMHNGRVTVESEPAGEAGSYLRWHPLRREWIIYAPHRQNRTYKPPAEYCPLCPTPEAGFASEIPFEAFEIAVFENRFSSLTLSPVDPPVLAVPTEKAVGRCEVVVFSDSHSGNLGTLSQERLALLIRVWADRCQSLYANPEIQCVMPFENRGELCGVTLHHPHGQIYSYGHMPSIIARQAEAFRERPVLLDTMATMGDAYTVIEDRYTHAFVPPFNRYPFEVWIAPKTFHPGPWTLNDAEITSFAEVLSRMIRTYDHLFEAVFPYLMILYVAPKGEEATFHFHIEFFPPLRSANKIKYLAGTETGAGCFTVDVLPEEAAQILREALVD